MRKIVHPVCVCCRKNQPEYESQQWPTIRVCYRCLYELTSWFIDSLNQDLLDHNPLTEELFGNVFHGGSLPNDSQYTIWYQGRGRSDGASCSMLIQRVDNFFEQNG